MWFQRFSYNSFSPIVEEKYKDFPALQDIVHSSLLEELIFWTFKYEFPQNFVCFLLNMLPDPEYKVKFTEFIDSSESHVKLSLNFLVFIYRSN